MAVARTIGELAAAVAQASGARLSARLLGDAGRPIDGVGTLEGAGPTQLSFLANARYRQSAAGTLAGALVLAPADRLVLFADGGTDTVLVECDAPYAWFAFAAQQLAAAPPSAAGVHASAVVGPGARIDPTATVGPLAVIGAGSELAAGVRIGAGAIIGAGVVIGADSVVHAGVRIYDGCRLGQRGIVHSGAVIGADGFGFAPFQGAWVKIPQTGAVRVGDDVEIGANTTVDRGAVEDTVIEDGVKIDNQVQIAHNCRIGAHTAIAGCVGIAGSAIIGRGCQLGGAAMIHGHISIADGTVVSAGTLISRSVHTAGFYTGIFPAMPNRDWERNAALLRHLDELRDRVRRLESAARAAAKT